MYHSNEPYDGQPKPYEQSGGDSYEEGWESDPAYHPPQEEDAPRKRTIFKPRLTKPNFVLSVLVNAVRLTALLIVLCGLALAGAVVGIAKGYMETAPTLDLTLLDDQDKTSFLYDAQGNVITDYKGTENRIMVNISLMPETCATPLSPWRMPAFIPTTALTSSASSAPSSKTSSPARSRAARPSPSS